MNSFPGIYCLMQTATRNDYKITFSKLIDIVINKAGALPTGKIKNFMKWMYMWLAVTFRYLITSSDVFNIKIF